MRAPQLQCQRCDSGAFVGRERRATGIHIVRRQRHCDDAAGTAGTAARRAAAAVAVIVILHGRQVGDVVDDDRSIVGGENDYFHETWILGEMRNDCRVSEVNEMGQ